MNAYGRRAMDYMARHRPAALAALTDPETYFADLGETILAQVLTLSEALAGPAPAAESFEARTGRLGMARLMAEEQVLGDLVYSSWEDPEDEPETDETGAWIGGPADWVPLLPPDPEDDEQS